MFRYIVLSLFCRTTVLKILEAQYLNAAKYWDHDDDNSSNVENTEATNDETEDTDNESEAPKNETELMERVLWCWEKDGWYYPVEVAGKRLNETQIRHEDGTLEWVNNFTIYPLRSTNTASSSRPW